MIMWTDHSCTSEEFDLIYDIRQAPAEVGKQTALKGAVCLFTESCNGSIIQFDKTI